jgi:2-methylcitrate dehydratase
MSNTIPRRDVLFGLSALGMLSVVRGAAAAPAPEAPAHPLAEQLAAYADELRFVDIDDGTVETVKLHVIDTLGCAIGAFDEGPVRICRDLALAAGSSASTIIGTKRRSTIDLATFANAAATRYFDLNDAYSLARGSSHPSDAIPACLAVAEAVRTDAAELIAAIVLAYEVNCRLVDAFYVGERGWDTPVLTLPAVALAAGKLMGLDREKLTQAVNIALNDHISMQQTRVQTLSNWKGLGDPEAARNAVFAAMLARGGITGPAPIFEGRAGFFRQVSEPAARIDVNAFGGRGKPFKINRCEIKAYPAQLLTQTAIAAAIEVAQKAGGVERIVSVDIATSRRGYVTAGSEPEKWTPDTRETADHSLPYLTARAMFDGDITNDSYAPDKLRDPHLLAFMRKITVNEDPKLTAMLGTEGVPTRITATLGDGSRITRQADYVPGFAGRPMTRADVERKFRGNVGKRWPEPRIGAILQAFWDLDQVDDVSTLLAKLSVEPG